MPATSPVLKSDRGSRKGAIPPKILALLADTIGKIDFGQVTITVHHSRIVQIDSTEKVRFPDSFHENGGGI
jgi:hypothetical protein